MILWSSSVHWADMDAYIRSKECSFMLFCLLVSSKLYHHTCLFIQHMFIPSTHVYFIHIYSFHSHISILSTYVYLIHIYVFYPNMFVFSTYYYFVRIYLFYPNIFNIPTYVYSNSQ